MKPYQLANLNLGDRLVVTSGKKKGRTAVVVSVYGMEITLRLSDVAPGETDDSLKLHYSNVEEAGPDGQPVIRPVIDMTGREITDQSWIIYSVGGGRAKHGLEIGKVIELTKTGAVKVERMLADGKPVRVVLPWEKKKKHKIVNDPDRSLTLPCDAAVMTEWVLKDFTDLKDQC